MKIFSFFIIILLFICGCSEFDSLEPYISVSSSDTTVNVGSLNPITVTINVHKDAKGDECGFNTTHGVFTQTNTNEAKTVVDVYGNATVSWLPPSNVVDARITAMVGEVYIAHDITVAAVPPLVITYLPDTLTVNSSVLLSVSTSNEWGGHFMDLIAPNMILTATTPVKDETKSSTGSQIAPQIDQNGLLQVYLKAPENAGTYLFSASLYGTIVRKSIVVQ